MMMEGGSTNVSVTTLMFASLVIVPESEETRIDLNEQLRTAQKLNH
jgi:hypothetical protein